MTAAAIPGRATRRPGLITDRQRRIAIVLVVAAVGPPVLAGLGLLSDLWALVFGVGVTYAMMALSLNLLMGYAGQVSLGHAGLVAVGAYVSGIATGRGAAPNLISLMVAAGAGALIAFVIGLPALRLRGLYLAITTIGFVVMMSDSVLQIPWLSRGSAGVELPRPEAWSYVMTENAHYLAYLLVFLVAFWVLDTNVLGSRVGRAFLAIREDEEVAQAFGVDTARYKILAFVLSGALAGVAGALFGHLLLFANSEVFDLAFSLELLIFVVIGGLGSRLGVLIAAFAFGVMPEVLQQVFAWEAIAGWEYIVGAALLIFTVARHPGGLAQALRDAREAKAAERARRGEDLDADALETVPQLPQLPQLSRPASVLQRHDLLTGDAMLEVDGVTVGFGGLTAVDGASLVVPNGVIVGLIGPNGAGKTTLFNTISGLQPIDAGSIRFLGREISQQPPHARTGLGIARTFQRGGLAQNLSVRDNLLLAQHHLGDYAFGAALLHSRAVADAEAGLHGRAQEVIDALDYERYAETPVRNLSGGQRRIVEMACALVTAPDLLLLDEPSAGMAPAVVEDLADRLREIRDGLGQTVLLVEHHIPLVLDVCDHVYVLDHGRVIASGRPDDVAHHPDVLDAYLGRRHRLPDRAPTADALEVTT
jgi:branched-chain amino acid transport system permease protein